MSRFLELSLVPDNRCLENVYVFCLDIKENNKIKRVCLGVVVDDRTMGINPYVFGYSLGRKKWQNDKIQV